MLGWRQGKSSELRYCSMIKIWNDKNLNFNDNRKNTKESTNVNADCALKSLTSIDESMESIMNLHLPSVLLTEWCYCWQTLGTEGLVG